MPKHKKSKVWMHMKQLSDGKAMCKHCNMVVVISGGTSNLARHLSRHHGIETQPHPAGKIMEKLLMAPTSTTTSAGVTLTTQSDTDNDAPPLPSIGSSSQSSAVASTSTMGSSSQSSATASTSTCVNPFTLAHRGKMPEFKKQKITVSVCKYIVKSLRPYHTVENPYFRAMVHELNPAYQLPNRHDVSERLIPAMYKAALGSLKEDLKNADCVSLTGDGWSSRVADHYMTLTVHYLKDWDLECKVLQTLKAEVQQTGENITVEIDQCLAEFGLEGKVTSMTTDNARAMLNATGLAGVGMSLGCFAHTLNLAAQKLLEVKALTTLLSTIRPVITYFRKSYLGKLVLKEKQEGLNVPANSLLLDCKTRWNSTYLMIERFIQQYPAVMAATMDERIRKKEQFKKLQRVSDNDFNKMETFVQVAALLYKMTTAMSTEQRPTAGMVLPTMDKLKDHFSASPNDSPFAASLKAGVLKDLNKRYQGDGEREFLEEATALDARFKTFCKGEDVWDRLCHKVTAKHDKDLSIKKEANLAKMDDGNTETEPEPEKEGQVTAVKAPKKKSPLDEIFHGDEVEITSVTPPVPLRVRVQNEIGRYRAMNKLMPSQDTVLFWKENSTGLPLLSVIARQYLTAQASSVASERIFSTAGDVVKAERACLEPGNVNMLIFLKKNLP
ncbi:E3 SUMO-protein ligase ZBED1-like [Branchiostoma floridae x Branchiostoma japonicum]